MRIRPLAYFILLLLAVYLFYTLVQLYSSPWETVTYPPLGFLNVSKPRILLSLVGTTLMLPALAALLLGAITQAEWLNPVRFYSGMVAIIVCISRQLSPQPIGSVYSFLDIAFLYLIAEGLIVVVEGVKHG
jgi:hypothetical protein